ncbi:hypothetical protein Gbth_017_064 [Gluconobacter thailandicus F149-1 = NBRC 100600]|uniref:Uncharacterized protein n=1 Tax=Gluconobacter thailandicus NBRC 3257 TaxID=1381097 RepID=A0ABQ0IVV5_GLUTH|nr:hypothetical protein [Gluconobacter thailandicus]GAN89651.1 hypothetical protein Gbfr_007_108 [Gluconobacter frateurii M-2]GAC87766.1 hypothetical protein NBRC3255_1427 [Gluconobacter thailandicus NBRC 3255]GAD26346.1 hypothetical protein NBRC3257_1345 [Gluconobacter thailandicus NBRC 3257]GAN92889.1 hypothetical protein Gbth_017_064 [Gluconobacter thailandicus F149-1 = NBRC 100600]GBR61499.1 hypothetical protein AA100600_2838 [Gluconobacter thailandicus F149-1 = NBRC 100600]
MSTEVPDTTRDVPVITGKALIILHICLIAFIGLVHLRLVTMTGN